MYMIWRQVATGRGVDVGKKGACPGTGANYGVPNHDMYERTEYREVELARHSSVGNRQTADKLARASCRARFDETNCAI